MERDCKESRLRVWKDFFVVFGGCWPHVSVWAVRYLDKRQWRAVISNEALIAFVLSFSMPLGKPSTTTKLNL